MKLVDILARELKAWPEGVSSLSQLQHNGAIINGKGYDGREWARIQIAEDTPPAGVIVTEDQWRAAFDALKAESRPTESMPPHHQEVGRINREWDGEGLPPVGTDCEAKVKGGNGEWKAYKALALTAEYMIVSDDKEETPIRHPYWDFRPMRTADQIAAEERLAAINYMEIDAGMCATAFDGDPEARVWINNLIDKGWRKQVKP